MPKKKKYSPISRSASFHELNTPNRNYPAYVDPDQVALKRLMRESRLFDSNLNNLLYWAPYIKQANEDTNFSTHLFRELNLSYLKNKSPEQINKLWAQAGLNSPPQVNPPIFFLLEVWKKQNLFDVTNLCLPQAWYETFQRQLTPQQRNKSRDKQFGVQRYECLLQKITKRLDGLLVSPQALDSLMILLTLGDFQRFFDMERKEQQVFFTKFLASIVFHHRFNDFWSCCLKLQGQRFLRHALSLLDKNGIQLFVEYLSSGKSDNDWSVSLFTPHKNSKYRFPNNTFFSWLSNAQHALLRAAVMKKLTEQSKQSNDLFLPVRVNQVEKVLETYHTTSRWRSVACCFFPSLQYSAAMKRLHKVVATKIKDPQAIISSQEIADALKEVDKPFSDRSVYFQQGFFVQAPNGHPRSKNGTDAIIKELRLLYIRK